MISLMKKSVLVLSALSALFAISFTSCQKDKVVATSFTATLEECQDDDGKTAFTNGTMQWVSGDQIKVFGSAGSGVYEASVRGAGGTTFNVVSGDAGAAPYRAVYPASAANDDGTIELPVVQVTEDGSLTGFPMYAESDGTNLDFKNLCGVLRMRLQKSGVSVTAIEVTGDIELTGDYNVYYNSGVPTLEYSSHGTKTTMMTCNTAQSIANQKDFYIFLPAHTYSAGMRIRIYSSDGGVCTKTVSAGNSVRVQRGKITTITLRNNSLTFAPNAGALPGLFTINENGDQVRFSQGNLQYTTLGTHAGALGSNMPGIWRFAPEQYEYVGEDIANINVSYHKWVNHFGWGTGANPICRSGDNSDYQTFVDWGTNNIVNGYHQSNAWRTLSAGEWNYLIFHHAFVSGSVNGIHGRILLPDNWTLPSTCTFNPDDNNESWNNNSYSLSQWADMEESGAIFLPASGDCWGSYVNNIDDNAWYWSSSIDDGYINFMSFDEQGIGSGCTVARSTRCSVRLVIGN